MSEAPQTKPIDRLIPWFFVLFFLVISIVDGIFVYIAIHTHTGVVTDKAYEKGLAYDELLDEAAQQKALGVQSNVSYKDSVLTLELLDKDGASLGGALVKADIIRAVSSGHDFSVTLTPAGKGVYSAQVQLPLPGAWTVKIEAQWNNQVYRTTYKLVAD